MDERVEQCKKHDKLLEGKIAERERKRGAEEREALRKSRSYSVELVEYWKRKEREKGEVQRKIEREFEEKEKAGELDMWRT